MTYSNLLIDIQDKIALVTLNRPQALNALNKDLLSDISQFLDDAKSDENIKVIIITGSGEKSFVAGADIKEFSDFNGEQGSLLAKQGQDNVFDKLENFPKPIIAAVNGFALGGGLELAMACHFRIASDNAKLGLPEVTLGLIPGYGGTQRLVQLIGKGKAMELLITADMIKADEAKALGLVNHVFTSEELLAKTTEILTKIQTKAPIAVGKIIALVNEAATVSKTGLANEIKAFGECFDTEDKQEGAAAFLEKRNANFKGK